MSKYSYFDEELLLFLSDVRDYPVFPHGVVTLGNGPYDEAIFDELLNRCGVYYYSIYSRPQFARNVLILGRSNWDATELDEYVASFEEHRLRVYSQEMFLDYLATGKDPYYRKDLFGHCASGHPAIEHLFRSGFKWPKTEIVPSNGELSGEVWRDWPKEGLLKHMGYCVGRNGKSKRERQAILTRVFTGNLPNVDSPQYMAEWGRPHHWQRLRKLAETIAAFSRNAKRRQTDMADAVTSWEDDLAWLRSEYYDGSFPWPLTDLQRTN